MADSKMVLVHHLILASSRHAAQTPSFHAWTLAWTPASASQKSFA